MAEHVINYTDIILKLNGACGACFFLKKYWFKLLFCYTIKIQINEMLYNNLADN